MTWRARQYRRPHFMRTTRTTRTTSYALAGSTELALVLTGQNAQVPAQVAAQRMTHAHIHPFTLSEHAYPRLPSAAAAP